MFVSHTTSRRDNNTGGIILCDYALRSERRFNDTTRRLMRVHDLGLSLPGRKSSRGCSIGMKREIPDLDGTWMEKHRQERKEERLMFGASNRESKVQACAYYDDDRFCIGPCLRLAGRYLTQSLPFLFCLIICFILSNVAPANVMAH